jgi:hypothetical protein
LNLAQIIWFLQADLITKKKQNCVATLGFDLDLFQQKYQSVLFWGFFVWKSLHWWCSSWWYCVRMMIMSWFFKRMRPVQLQLLQGSRSLGKKRVLESSITRATGAVWFHAKWLHAFNLQNYSLTWIFLNAMWPEENTCHCWVVLFRVTLQRLGHCWSSLSFPVLLIHCSIWNLSVYHVVSESWSNPGNFQETHFDQICVIVNEPILLHQSWKWETPR